VASRRIRSDFLPRRQDVRRPDNAADGVFQQPDRILERFYATVFVRVPIRSIHTFITSPDLRNSRLTAPTPAGVPVRTRFSRMKRDPGREISDLLCDGENHLARMGILLDDVIDPQLDSQILRVPDLFCRQDPGPRGQAVSETLMSHPVVLKGEPSGHSVEG